jgi:hypothetical protein
MIEQPKNADLAQNNNKAKTNFETQSILIPPNRMTPLKNNW